MAKSKLGLFTITSGSTTKRLSFTIRLSAAALQEEIMVLARLASPPAFL